VLDSEFDDETAKQRFMGEREEPTNLSEHADEWWLAQSDD
jgi:DNA-directed RNA polymerase subunit A'